MVSVGLWDKVNHVGRLAWALAIMLHEPATNPLELPHHGGFPTIGTPQRKEYKSSAEANCKPDYLSVMSYSMFSNT